MLARDLERRVGHNWEKYFVSLFHVSEHLDHFVIMHVQPRREGGIC